MALLVGSFWAAAAHAEDIDIYASTQSVSAEPNVLIVIDNSSNWSAQFQNADVSCSSDKTRFCNIKQALSSVVTSLGTNSDGSAKINIGLMMFNLKGDDGGFVRFGVRPMTTTNQNFLSTVITGLANDTYNGTSKFGDRTAANAPIAKSFFEAYKYFGGGGTSLTPQGTQNYGPAAFMGGTSNTTPPPKRDYDGNTTYINSALNGDGHHAFSDSSSNTYISPISNSCQKNFIIYIASGQPGGGDTTGGVSAATLLNNVQGSNSQLSLGDSNGYAEEFANFLNKTDLSSTYDGTQNITTFTLAVYDPKNGCTVNTTTGQYCIPTADQTWINNMGYTAKYGGGTGYLASDFAGLEKALRDIVTNILATNSVFASASLPVSVNTQGTYLNQVFIGQFRPDDQAKPRWPGNMKQYQFAFSADQSSIFLADKNGDTAINDATGFIKPCAVSFWTSGNSSYWSSVSGVDKSTCDTSTYRSTPTDLYDDTPDGDLVERGAAAAMLRAKAVNSSTGAVTRTMKTCNSSGCTSLTDFDSNLNSALKSVISSTSSEQDTIINWVRGLNNKGDEFTAGTSNVMRPYVHGDVVHGRPLAVNYPGSTTDSTVPKGVVVFYGANDGVLHAVIGAQDAADTNIGTATPGDELFGFVGYECLSKLKRLRDNTTLVKFPTVTDTSATAKDYCFDGAMGLYQNGSTVWIFPSMRRGGRAIYAFDVSAPTSPTLKWRKTNTDSGFSSLGYTWSTPRVAKLNGYGSTYTTVFGGGYDTCEDQDAVPNTSCGSTQNGSGVYVVNADTGALIKYFDFSTGTDANGNALSGKSVAADITLVDSDFDGDADLAYAVDIRGNLFRMDFTGAGPTDWTLAYIATLGGTTSTADRRKFLFGPDVVVTNDYNAVLVGSGDREHPLTSSANYSTVSNRFYMVKDTGTVTTPITESQLTDLGSVSSSSYPATSTISNYGWRADLRSGEQVVTSATTVGGFTYFSTHEPTDPAAGSCNSLGTARGYKVDFTDGSPDDTGVLSAEFTGGGLPPSPVAGLVSITNASGDTVQVPFVIGGIDTSSGGEQSALSPVSYNPNLTRNRTRVYWRELID